MNETKVTIPNLPFTWKDYLILGGMGVFVVMLLALIIMKIIAAYPK